MTAITQYAEVILNKITKTCEKLHNIKLHAWEIQNVVFFLGKSPRGVISILSAKRSKGERSGQFWPFGPV